MAQYFMPQSVEVGLARGDQLDHGGLSRIVSREDSDEDIGIEPDHRSWRAPRAMPASISSRLCAGP